MSEDAPHKTVRDPESFRDALEAWMRRQRPDATGLRVGDVDMPRATGFSNETVFFTASYREGGEARSERLVARIEPRDLGIFPVQTSPESDVSVGLQHRVTTLEPCPYCTGAIRMEKLKAVHFAARDPSAGSTHLLNVGEFMQMFPCTVNPPANLTLEAAIVALVMEHGTREGHHRWRDHWCSCHESGVEVGESLALKGQHAEWVQRGVTPETLYDEVCSNFR